MHRIGSGEEFDPSGSSLLAEPGDPQAGAYLRQGYPHPIAYTYEAAYHCPVCAAIAWGVSEDGWIPEDVTDSEGNPIGAVAPWDEWAEFGEPGPWVLACDTCGGIIEEIEDTD
jgi:hypothetical protein